MFRKFFFDHPAEAGETYWQHLAFTARTAWELTCIGAALAIHGIFPFLFSTTASGRITAVYQTLSLRAHKTSQVVQNRDIPALSQGTHAAAARKAA